MLFFLYLKNSSPKNENFQVIQDVDAFVSSLEQTWKNEKLPKRQNESPNS